MNNESAVAISGGAACAPGRSFSNGSAGRFFL
jgi:hypothetical protein